MHTCPSQLQPVYQGTKARRVVLCDNCTAVVPVDPQARLGGLSAVPTHHPKPARGQHNA